MKSLWRFLITFLAVTGAVVLATMVFGVRFESADFWDHHGLVFLVFISFFPRLTLLLSSVPTGGLLWWLGFIFAPRILVATLATLVYWRQNPVLVVVSWLVAVGGESSEKYVVATRSRGYANRPGGRPEKGYEEARWGDRECPAPLSRN